MNILLFMTAGMSLNAWRQAGTLTRELALYERLAGLGAKIGIISYGGKEERELATPFPWLSVHSNVWGLSAERYARWLPLLHAAPLMRADVLKSNQMSGADAALRCARLWNKPFVARCGYMWSEFALTQSADAAKEIDRLERHIFTEARHCIVTTEDMRESILARTARQKEDISVFPNYVPDYLFTPPARAKADLDARICYVGRLSEQKNLPALVQACQDLPVTLRLIGEGPDHEALQALAERLHVQLEMPGRILHEDLGKELDAATACALVSHYEGNPKALLEYMARGRPILATNAPGIANLIRHEENGLLCSPDPSSIREGLQRLLGDPELRERLGAQTRADARAFSLQASAEREFGLYRQITRQPGGASLPCFLRHAVRALPRLGLKKARALASRGLDGLAAKLAANPCLARRLGPLFAAPRAADVSAPTPPAPSFNLSDTARALASACAELPAADALRLIFTLENSLYSMAGNFSVAYDNGLHTKHRHTQYHAFFVNRLSAGENVLDIGCGNGFLAYDMARSAGAFVTGIDLNPDNITVAQERFRHERVSFIHGDALTDLPSGVYDVVVLSNVLEHLSGRPEFLQKIQKRLGPKRYLIRVPLFERDWRVPLKRELGLEWRLDTSHETEYTQEEFLREMRDAALTVRHIEFRWSEIWCELYPAGSPVPVKD
ncbi:MAG: glycosyltransferase [Desulfovibrio sp.]|jgi:glycosyltransferase involved in cell wall biosynthesis/SAM-dependent methyltransferase|nr:glycosyltransferase [Desulfovibrio sp.]